MNVVKVPVKLVKLSLFLLLLLLLFFCFGCCFWKNYGIERQNLRSFTGCVNMFQPQDGVL